MEALEFEGKADVEELPLPQRELLHWLKYFLSLHKSTYFVHILFVKLECKPNIEKYKENKMKKFALMMTLILAVSMLTGCQSKDAKLDETVPESSMIEETTMAPEGTSKSVELTEGTEAVASAELTDNFSVPEELVEDFAKEIQAAVSAQDLEALANLAAYPMYIGFADGGVPVENDEDLIAMGVERIFTPEMVASIEGAETSELSASKAGFSLSKDGSPNIIFGVRDGKLAIQGMNY